MIYLRQSTASQEVPLGYFVDSTNGNDEETALTIANTDIKVWKTGATTLASKNSGGATHISNGIYSAVLDATDTDTIGPLVLFCHVSGALTTRLECYVLDEAVYDAMFGTSALATASGGAITVTSGRVNADVTHIATAAVSTTTAQLGVNVVQISTDATAADNAESFFDGTGYAGTGNVIPTVTTLTNDPTGVTTLLSRLGTPSDLGGGATVSANLSDIEGQTDDIGTAGAGLTAVPWNAAWDAEVQSEVSDELTARGITSAFFAGITSLAQWLGLMAGKQTPNSTALTEIKATGAGSGTYDATTDSLEAERDNIGTAGAGLTAADDAVITAIAALNNLSAAQVNTEADTALADVGLTTTVTGRIDRAISAILTTAMTESYNADGSAPTPAQALFVIMQALTEHSVSSTTWTMKKLDGTTTAFTLTLNDATNPTSVTRAT